MKAYCPRCEEVTDHKPEPDVECTVCGRVNGDSYMAYCKSCGQMKSWEELIELECNSCAQDEEGPMPWEI
jgi:hypothetical protein